MFSVKQRDDVRERVLALATSDPRVTAGALTGSMSLGTEDHWSDIDVAFGIAAGIAPATVLQDWTAVFEQEFGVLDHFDLISGPSIYRVFLLTSGLEVDVAVTPEHEFGALGPTFRPLFGTSHQRAANPPPDAAHLIGLSWHHVLHARSYIERGKLWQGEYWISELRDHTFALACLRFGESAVHGRGIARLPPAVTEPFVATLVRSLDVPELRRALAATTACLLGEVALCDPALCANLTPILHAFGAS